MLTVKTSIVLLSFLLLSPLGCAPKQIPPDWVPPPIELNPDTTLVCDDPAEPGCATPTPFDELLHRTSNDSEGKSPHYVRLLNIGDETLLLITHLIRSARKSIYIEQFIWSPDESGMYIFQELVKAARRGVEVKIVNDWFINFGDVSLATAIILAHKNLEEKVYNPTFTQLETSHLQIAKGGITNMSGINQRMHNKLLVVDEKIGILGGRNYENKYFDRDSSYNFKDRDIVIVGPVVQEMVKSFYEYWNYEFCVPLYFLDDVGDRLAADDALPDLMEIDVGASFQEIDRNASDYEHIRKLFVETAYRVEGQVEFFADAPGKPEAQHKGAAWSTQAGIRSIVTEATSSLVIQTPYLILTKDAQRGLRRLRKRQSDLEIIASTNSLAAADHYFTYAITMKQKKRLLKKVGIRIYELKPVPGDVREINPRYDLLLAEGGDQDQETDTVDRMPTTAAGPVTGIHAKSMVIDDRIAFVGSHNFDPRSVTYDTQLGIAIWDTEVARALKANILRDTEPQNSWVVVKHQKVPIVSFFGGIIEDISRALPIFDVWPFKYSTSWELREGENFP
jgi:phosphatidylserine/phosphatidylglycerophosphate/cardiolipin synthase-like enzyme